MEQQLDCTLEELCFGCIKKMKITRDAVTDDGQMVEEDEVLTIKVKPGWTKGTKITFEGMGDEIPGTDPADVIFVVAEKDHPLFRRQDDDLELEVEIPLIGALTGCTISVPLLDGQTMSLTIDDIVHPGYEKIIAEQGMPKQNEPAIRGNMVITFSVKFPEELTEEQRSDAANILHHTC
ncbi:UNVERIFIED_CONTAM: DnaJsubfamily B member 13 [Sesamum angustifolium]|uniref:DnaJsubfamily B member 13 n=1 Tax=Sesamum angustifolium TaxID=2727405 RepID=A0AAW2L824_9LAMI